MLQHFITTQHPSLLWKYRGIRAFFASTYRRLRSHMRSFGRDAPRRTDALPLLAPTRGRRPRERCTHRPGGRSKSVRGQRYPGAPPSQHGAVRAGRLAFQATLWRRAAGPLFQRGRRAKPQKSAVPSALGTMLSTSASMPSSLLSPPSCLSASTLTQRGGSLGLSSGPGPTRLAVSHRHTVPSSEPVTRQPLARCCEIVVTPFACCCSANRHSPRCSLRVVRGSSQAGLGLGLGLGLRRRRRRRQRRRRRWRRRRRQRRS